MNNSIKFYGSIPKSLKKRLEESLGHAEIDSGKEIAIYFDSVEVEKSKRNYNILLLSEPPTVSPQNYRKSQVNKFDLVIIFSPWLAKSTGMPNFTQLPVETPIKTSKQSTQRNNGIVLINDHKFSAVNSSLYGYRRKILLELQKRRITIALFGPNWKMSRSMEFRKRVAALRLGLKNLRLLKASEAFSELFRDYHCYQGHAVDKMQTLSNYKYALIIENDENWLSEKLFDALYAGCLVFYLGPSLAEFDLLSKCIIKLPSDPVLAASVIQENFDNTPWQILEESRTFTNDSSSMEFVRQETIFNSILQKIQAQLRLYE